MSIDAVSLPARARSASPARVGALATTAVLAMFVGLLQNTVSTYVDSPYVVWIDDLLVLLLVPIAAPRILKLHVAIGLAVGVWFAVLLVALLGSSANNIPFGDAFFLFRQVVMPAILVMIGLVLTRREWRVIQTALLWVAGINIPYMLLEIFRNTRLVDPAITSRRDGQFIFPNGVPGAYIVFDDSGQTIRAGGLFLNPPTAGIVMALAAVVVYNTYRGGWRWVGFVAFAGCTWGTYSRAGMLVLAAGVGFAVLGKVVGRAVASLVIFLAGLVVAVELNSVEGAAVHLEGLVGGLEDALNYPYGRGFGFAGNYSRHLTTFSSAESLTGIAFSAAGLIAVIVYSLLIISVIRKLAKQESWMAAAAIGMVVAALVAETAGSLDATVPGWLLVGYVLSSDFNDGHLPGTTIWQDRRERLRRRKAERMQRAFV